MSRLLIVALLAGLALSAPARAHEDLATLDLKAYQGKVVYLDFWASWCGPCRKSFPFLDGLQRKYGKDGLVVIAVNVDTERALATEFLREVPVGFKVVYDPKGALASQWQLLGMPSSFVIGRDGQVRGKHTGFRSADQAVLESAIVNLLKEQGARP
jgi:cytochrome c biogenesis protein CcmG/thiol:disulfide interchange protein DsbE